MKIKLIPETDAEISRYKDENGEEIEEIVYENVKGHFISGFREDEDGDLVDFHEWHGSYRFLIGDLQYYYEVINDERRGKSNVMRPPASVKRPKSGQAGKTKKPTTLEFVPDSLPSAEDDVDVDE